AKLEAALGASEDAVLLLSAAPGGGTVALGNPRFEELFGLDPRSLTGLSLAELGERLEPLFAEPEEVRSYLAEFHAAAAGPPAAASFETAGVPRRTIELSSRAARDRDGR